MIKIGDFVTSCEAGYWQLIDIKPKIADEDYSGENIRWKKGDMIGQWAILKKAFTPKMKPRIDFPMLIFPGFGLYRPRSCRKYRSTFLTMQNIKPNSIMPKQNSDQ